MPIDISVVNKIVLSRHLFSLSLDSLKAHQDVALLAATNLMQDAVEAFLLAVSECVNAGVDSSTTFERYFTKIDEKIHPRELPFRVKLVALNKVRVAAKHHGVKPDREVVESFAVACREFFDEACTGILGAAYWSIGPLHLLQEGPQKDFLVQAKVALDAGHFWLCLVECRKAIYVEFERNYDVAVFAHAGVANALLKATTSAPFYARNANYIEESVRDPFDFVAMDFAGLSNELLADGIDTQAFWNIWRLTPPVYRRRKGFEFHGDWLIKRDLTKESNASAENAAYVFANTVDILVRVQQRRRRLRGAGYGNYVVYLLRDRVPAYEKADRNSRVAYTTFPGVHRIRVDYSTPGLNEAGVYWHALGQDHSPASDQDFEPFFGFVHEEDIDSSKAPVYLR